MKLKKEKKRTCTCCNIFQEYNAVTRIELQSIDISNENIHRHKINPNGKLSVDLIWLPLLLSLYPSSQVEPKENLESTTNPIACPAFCRVGWVLISVKSD